MRSTAAACDQNSSRDKAFVPYGPQRRTEHFIGKADEDAGILNSACSLIPFCCAFLFHSVERGSTTRVHGTASACAGLPGARQLACTLTAGRSRTGAVGASRVRAARVAPGTARSRLSGACGPGQSVVALDARITCARLLWGRGSALARAAQAPHVATHFSGGVIHPRNACSLKVRVP